MMKAKGITVKFIALICALLTVLSVFSGCNSECRHTYINGVCTVCKEACPHSEYRGGVCVTCGIVCEHEEYENGVCKTCGTVCGHEEYDDGECVECGEVCGHDEYVNGICKVCGTKCLHLQYTQGVCAECGILCVHEKYVGGVCAECELVCTHAEYAEGKCKVCGTVCTHNFVENVCKICGFEKTSDPVDDYDGTMSKIYVNSNGTFIADATRYVPSYDNNNAANNIDWQYHDCTVTVGNCEAEYKLEATAGIKVRGNWTTTYPKKPFRIKFDKKQTMLGLNNGAKCKSWVLLADYKDCSLERNSVAFWLGQSILGEDGYYCSDYRQVELYLDGEYWGVYLLAEQQQVNQNRINISEPADPQKSTNNEHLATDIGYLIEYDGYYNLEIYNERFGSNHNHGYAIKSDVYENEAYPEYPAAGNEGRYPQKKFIQSYINNLYTLCTSAVNKQYYAFNDDFTRLVSYTPQTDNPVYETVSKAIDVQSLVDTYILNEIACDADLGWSSFFMDVDFGPDAKNNLLRFEAPWDYDSSLGFKAGTCESGIGDYVAGSGNHWLNLFRNESWFKDLIKTKWQQMKADGVQSNALQFINDLKYRNSEAYQRNFNKWGFVVNGEAKWEILNSVHNHTDAVNQLHSWLNTRFNYLDSQWL